MECCPHCGGNLGSQTTFAFGNVEIRDGETILFNGRPLSLPRTLYLLADSIIRGRGRGLTRGILADRLGGDVFDESITKYVERLRACFRTIDPQFDQIEAIRGFGAYRWRLQIAYSLTSHVGHKPTFLGLN